MKNFFLGLISSLTLFVFSYLFYYWVENSSSDFLIVFMFFLIFILIICYISEWVIWNKLFKNKDLKKILIGSLIGITIQTIFIIKILLSELSSGFSFFWELNFLMLMIPIIALIIIKVLVGSIAVTKKEEGSK